MNGLHPEDYLEPSCVFCKPEDETAKPVDLRRCLDRLDAYLDRNDYAAARRHLDYWKAEALANNDLRGLVSIENERMGLFRKLGDEAAAREAVDSALALLPRTGLEDTVTAGTTLLNAATVYKRFGRAAEGLPLYEKARAIYEGSLPEADGRLGGLYNNMGLAYMALKRFGEAYAAFLKALDVMAKVENGALEQAITYLNLANAVELEHGLEKGEQKIGQYLDKAAALLDEPTVPRDGYYAFVCEKCAPTFDYYGYFLVADDLNERAKSIYERA